MINPIHDVCTAIEQGRPDIWRQVYPRSYAQIGGWHSPKDAAFVHAGCHLSAEAMKKRHTYQDSAASCMSFATILCDEHEMPTFFVSRTLLEAVEMSDPPSDLPFSEIKMPFSGLTFVLPIGTGVISPSGEEVSFISIGRLERGRSFLPAPRSTSAAPCNILFIGFGASAPSPVWACSLSDIDGSAAIGKLRVSTQMDPEPCIKAQDNSTLVSMDDAENEFCRRVNWMAVGILLAMTARPELIERGRLLKKARGNRRELWSPNVIGRGFRAAGREAREDAAGISPRMHWRRGHFRNQACGKGRTERRVAWIEPCLIAAETEKAA